MKSFKEFNAELNARPALDEIILTEDGKIFELFEDRKWISGRFDRNIGIDQPTSGAGQVHAHVYGRKNNELVVVNFDGTASHGFKGNLSDKDADALRARGFKIRSGNLVEWLVVKSPPKLLFG
ncbi:hypothetical protein V3589_26995 [Sinorhizobium fredii]|uniref:hypothetical protein n=1 Tax=Rhizobium fredii TaxID=380 RepID=UPI0030984667